MSDDYVTLTTLRATGATMMAISTIAIGLRLYSPLRRPKRFQWDDGFLLGAYFFFLVISILYQVGARAMFRVEDVQTGKTKPYATIADDGLFIQKIFFVATSSLWFNLWCVKYSLLALYKRLMTGLKTYIIIWWAVVVFCFVVLVGAVTSSMLSCSSMEAWFTAGACSTPRDIKAAAISLWYSYAVDVITDLMVMFLPIGLIWRLQMRLSQKISVGGLFGLGWVCIVIATIRVRELGASSSESHAPRLTWLAFWGEIETAIAVVIGCCPGLYRRFRQHVNSRKSAYNPYNAYGYGYTRSGGIGATGNTRASRAAGAAGAAAAAAGGGGGGHDNIPLRHNLMMDGTHITKTTDISVRHQNDAASSQEQLTGGN